MKVVLVVLRLAADRQSMVAEAEVALAQTSSLFSTVDHPFMGRVVVVRVRLVERGLLARSLWVELVERVSDTFQVVEPLGDRQ